MEMTKHAAIYRSQRIKEIVEKIGIGQVIKERYTRTSWQLGAGAGGRWICITDTGIIIIKDEAKSKIVTIYVATQRELAQVYGGMKRVPAFLLRKVSRNETFFTKDGKTIWKN